MTKSSECRDFFLFGKTGQSIRTSGDKSENYKKVFLTCKSFRSGLRTVFDCSNFFYFK